MVLHPKARVPFHVGSEALCGLALGSLAVALASVVLLLLELVGLVVISWSMGGALCEHVGPRPWPWYTHGCDRLVPFIHHDAGPACLPGALD